MRGHIRQRTKDNKTWSIIIELEKINGKRKQKWYTFKGTKKDAEKFVEKQMSADIEKVANELHKNGFIKFSNNTRFDGKNLGGVINAALEERIKAQQAIFDDSSDKKKVEAKAKRAFLLLTEEKQKGNTINIVEKLCNQLVDTEITTREEIHEIVTNWKNQYGGNKDLKELADEFLRRTDVSDIKGRAEQTLNKIKIFEKALENSRLIQSNSEVILENLEKLKVETNVET